MRTPLTLHGYNQHPRDPSTRARIHAHFAQDDNWLERRGYRASWKNCSALFFCDALSERDFKAALGKLDEDHFELGCRVWSVICWSCLIYTICCIPIGTILLHSLRGLRGLMRWANWLNGRLGGQGLSRHQYLFEQIFVAIKTLPGGLEDFAVVVGIAGGEGEVTFEAA